jgi:glycosyltransferase involved in cell wall biosynthesis
LSGKTNQVTELILLAYFIFGFEAIRFCVAVVNLIFRQRTGRFPVEGTLPVSVLIPARNEENNIGAILRDLSLQNYRDIEIIVFNDQSDDGTAEIVAAFSKTDSRIRLAGSDGLPEGWLGKNHACHSLARMASGKYLLFLDADVRIGGEMIGRAVSFARYYNLGLLSIFPMQIILSPGEWMTVPNMNSILLSLLPLILVRTSRFSSLAAANGQFMLFNADTYRKHLPHEKMKSCRVEDIEIARYFKKMRIPTACLASENQVKCRMYSSFGEAVNGFSKNVVCFFGNSFLLAILFWLIIGFGFLAIWFIWSVTILPVYFLMVLATRIIIAGISGQSRMKTLFYLIPMQVSLGLFIFKAIIHKFTGVYQWKGRNIS